MRQSRPAPATSPRFSRAATPGGSTDVTADRDTSTSSASGDGDDLTVGTHDTDAVDQLFALVHHRTRPDHAPGHGSPYVGGRVNDRLPARAEQVGPQIVARSPAVDVRRRRGD